MLHDCYSKNGTTFDLSARDVFPFLANRLRTTRTMSLPKLTSLSTQTLSLLLERQRLQSLSANATGTRSITSHHLPQITRNLKQLRVGVLELESKDGKTEASKLLRGQYERMRGMLGLNGEEQGIERYESSTSAAPSRFVTTLLLVCQMSYHK